MKTLKTILLLASALLTGRASSEVLLWMVENPDVRQYEDYTGPTMKIPDIPNGGDVNAVRLGVHDSQNGTITYLDYFDSEAEVPGYYFNAVGIPDDAGNYYAGPVYSDVSAYMDSERYSFMIEIGNYQEGAGPNGEDVWTMLAKSSIATYSDLYDSGHISPDELHMPEQLGWGGGAYAVPEPTSGMLVLIGFGLLALKRKNVGGKAA